MKKRLVATLMSVAMTASLFAGLGVSAEEASPADQAIAERKARAEETGEYDKVVFAFYTWTGRPAGTDRPDSGKD